MQEKQSQKISKQVQLKAFFKKHKNLILISAGIVLAIATTTLYILLSNKTASVQQDDTSQQTQQVSTTDTVVEQEPIKYYSPLTGVLVPSEKDTTSPVTGVMIENSPDARPQSGLKNSGVVFEAIAEGGITRFLVLYQQEKPQMIGPVRSVRLYDVEWLAAFDAGLAHVGGSYYGLQEVRNGTYKDLDQFFNAGSYWRSSYRYSPHNVYTSFENLDALNNAKGYNSSTFTGFSRTDGKPNSLPDAANISMTISSAAYNPTYTYDPVNNYYVRYQGNEPHIDQEDGQIAPMVVIAMYVDETTVFEDGYREKITTIGSGKAMIFQNGTAISATWHKASKNSQITFTDEAGIDIPLVRGQTWITALPNGKGQVVWS